MKALQASLALAAIGAASFGVGWGLGRTDPTALEVEGQLSGARLDETDFSRKLAAATRSASGLEQSATMAELLPGMQAADFERLAPVLEASFGIGSAALPAQLFVERWAQLAPEAALARVSSWPADRRREAMPGLLRAWARTDPQAALATLDALEDRGLQRLSRRGLIQGWATTGDPGIWAFVARRSRGREQREMLIILTQQAAARDGLDGLLSSVAEQAGAQGEDGFGEEAMGVAADVLARADLQRAVAAAESCPPAPGCDAVTRAVAARWAGLDGEAACAWTRGLSPGEARDGAMYAAYSTWLRRDEAAAARWLDTQTTTQDLGPAHSARGRIMAQQGIGQAAHWADQVASPEMRRQAQIAVGRVYRRKDPAGAARWLDARGLSEEVPIPGAGHAAAEE
jgi:hypothetical protein